MKKLRTMANDCLNRLQINYDNEQILEKIHSLFYQMDEGKIRYTMMMVCPNPKRIKSLKLSIYKLCVVSANPNYRLISVISKFISRVFQMIKKDQLHRCDRTTESAHAHLS